MTSTLALTILHPVETFSWTAWRLYPDFLVGWLLLFGIYLLAAGPLRRYFPDSKPVPWLRVASFAFGMGLMLVALQGPLHELSDYFLFSAHMIQHLLIMLVMPPFLLLGLPAWMLRPIIRLPGVHQLARALTRPIIAFALINVIFGAWHFPDAYDLMMRDHTVHKTMHIMIMATGLIMWWPVMSPLPELPRIAAPLQMIYLFILGVPMMVVAAMITFSGSALYTWYVEAPRIFWLTPLDDQRLGGAIMWVPGALVIWIGITLVYFRWTHREVQEDEARLTSGLTREGLVFSPPPFPEL